ncbi:helix-turn-helix transcriptional regulator [Crocosphaera sp. UHCC 0190]|uniref:helix-turn-helix domain-containing protein n=1 Tax=unclassified Crocosphaera TaxID=2623705 RepID=UPI002B1F947E|nr:MULTISPECIES: helix-turn-helix transcriptional regulator [unclassified Crocosphaera]MEA5511927.1 helix-turn-helix transcriptional regulator [Crocosphaera sp. UHCC 0190]MEA5536663.1 helix-turn-helix transcriptional regulator [Crocosphaera sp. XPORK-15E]
MDNINLPLDSLTSILDQIQIDGDDFSNCANRDEFIEAFKTQIITQLEASNYKEILKTYFKQQINDTTNHTLSPSLLEESAWEAARNQYKNLLEFIKQMEIPKLIIQAWEEERILNQHQTEPITATRLFQNSPYAPIASCMPVVSGLEAITKNYLWQDNGELPAFFKKGCKSNSSNYIVHYITSPGDITLLPFREAQEIINKFSLDAGKLHLLFSAYCMKTTEPWRSEFTLKASDILKIFNENRKDFNKLQKLKEIASTAFMLDSLLVKAEWEEGKKNGKVMVSVAISRMWNISFNYQGHKNLFGEIETPEEIYITIQPGLWTKEFLNKAGQKARKALYQFGYISEELFKLNAYRDEFILRGLMYLTLASRFHPHGNYKVLTLLKECICINPDEKIAKAKSDRHSRLKLTNRWDNFLMTLSKMGWNITYDPVTYPEMLQPNSEKKKPRGYFEKWLEARLTILPPLDIPPYTRTLSTQKSSGTRKAKKDKSITASEIKAARLKKGWSQRQLAGKAGISASFICLIEKGTRNPDTKLMTHLCQLLDLEV